MKKIILFIFILIGMFLINGCDEINLPSLSDKFSLTIQKIEGDKIYFEVINLGDSKLMFALDGNRIVYEDNTQIHSDESCSTDAFKLYRTGFALYPNAKEVFILCYPNLNLEKKAIVHLDVNCGFDYEYLDEWAGSTRVGGNKKLVSLDLESYAKLGIIESKINVPEEQSEEKESQKDIEEKQEKSEEEKLLEEGKFIAFENEEEKIISTNNPKVFSENEFLELARQLEKGMSIEQVKNILGEPASEHLNKRTGKITYSYKVEEDYYHYLFDKQGNFLGQTLPTE